MSQLPAIRPWREYQILGVVSNGLGEEALIGHEVIVVRELPMPADLAELPAIRAQRMRSVEIFHNERLLPLVAKVKLVIRACRCPRKPFPHRWTRLCHVSPP